MQFVDVLERVYVEVKKPHSIVFAGGVVVKVSKPTDPPSFFKSVG